MTWGKSMGHLADSFHLTVGSPLDWVKRPRLWRLALGLTCFPLALSFLWADSSHAYWMAVSLGKPHILGWVGLLLATYLVVSAVASDLLHVHQVSFSKAGMHLTWSQVPGLLSERFQREKLFVWSELESLFWHEGESENDLQQHIKIQFKEDIGVRRSQLKILISDDRNPDRCEKLIAFLPEDFVAPEWIQAARKRRGH